MFDKEQVYREKIEPLVKEVYELCDEYDIPMVAAYLLRNNNNADILMHNMAVLNEDKTPLRFYLASDLLRKGFSNFIEEHEEAFKQAILEVAEEMLAQDKETIN